MSNYVLKYSKDYRVRYISHLDFIRTFHRAVRRAGLLMSFSQGFNPHPVMTIAMPLSVGVTSDCEYIKIGFSENYSEEELLKRINSALPDGFEVSAVRKTEGRELDFAQLDRAVYDVCIEYTGNFDADSFLDNKSLIVMKKSKSGEKEADIRGYIHSFDVTENTEGKMTVRMCLAAGNQYNLKPDTVIDAMQKYCPDFKPEFYMAHRKKILAGDKELL